MSFTLDVQKFVDKAKKNPEIVMRNVSIKLFSAIIKASPVDTGRFRMNWQAAGAMPASGTINAKDPSGNAAVSAMSQFVAKTPGWVELTLANNLPYAQRLEYGYSKQAPAGMVRVNVTRFNTLLEEEAKKVQ